MKHFICIALLFFLIITIPFESQSQGVAINEDNSTPNASAVLDVKSTTKGLLIPSMTTTQRNAIVTPAEGLIIYNTTTNEINQRQNGAWRAMITSDYWFRGANTMWNIGDNIGINTAGPSERLDVSGNIRSNSSMIIDNSSAILQLRSATVNKGFVQLSGDNLRLGTNSGNTTGNVVIRMDGNDRITINPQGDIDIEGKITKSSSTGNSSLTPLCFGKIDYDGSIISGTGNFTSIRISDGVYQITCAGVSVNSVVIITSNANKSASGLAFDDGTIDMIIHDIGTNALEDGILQFVVYNP
jgi:hypothetical protein